MYSLRECNDKFILIAKHPGVPFHKGDQPVGLVEKIRRDLNLSELYPLHRLDTMTSGLILFARNQETAKEIARLFREHRIEKYYIALAPGSPKKKQGTVKGDMVKGRNGVWILSHSLDNPAVTQFFSAGLGNGLRLYILRPYTGRTHQLRVMMKSLSVPILGDPLYFKNKYSLQYDRGYLHAFTLRFVLNGKPFCFTDLPEQGTYFTDISFRNALEQYREPWNLRWPKVKITL